MSVTLDKSKVIPSAAPTEAEIAVWQDLPRDEQVQRLRKVLTSSEASTLSDTTMAEIWTRIEARAQKHG